MNNTNKKKNREKIREEETLESFRESSKSFHFVNVIINGGLVCGNASTPVYTFFYYCGVINEAPSSRNSFNRIFSVKAE